MTKKILLLLVGVGMLQFGVSCSSTADYVMMNKTSQDLLAQAEDLMSSGKKEEAVKLVMMVRTLHPDDPKINALLNKLSPEERAAIDEDSMLGFNKAKRAEVESTTTEKVLWYLPDRIMDAIDMISLSLDVGAQIGVGVWATRAIQGVAYVGSTVGLGYFQKRNIGAKLESSFDLAIGPVGGTALYGMRAGTGGMDQVATGLWFHKPSEKLYQEYRDYWGIGFKFGLVYLGGEGEYHPVEIYDFLLGLATIDPLGDDFAHTRRLRFADSQKENMKKLQYLIGEGGEEGIAEYQKKYPKL